MNTTATKLIECVCGLRPIPSSPQNRAWITSPATGKTVTVHDGFFAELRAAAPRLVAKIAHARATGKRSASFSVDELKAFAALAAKIEQIGKPKPPPPGGYGRSMFNDWRGRRHLRRH
jgi:hypothetical protein